MSFSISQVDNMTQSHCNLDETVREIIKELMCCTADVLREVRKVWPDGLRAHGANPKLVLFSEKLVDLVIEYKEEKEAVCIDDIKIFKWFESSAPSPEKIAEKERYFQKTGRLPSEIVLDDENHLLDGYVSYLLAKEHGIKYVPVRYGKRQLVEAYHESLRKSYIWELPDYLVDRVLPGDKILVHTRYGVKCVTVAFIMEYGQQAHKGTLRMAIKKTGIHTY